MSSSSSSKYKDTEGGEVTVWSCDDKEYKLEQVEAMLSGMMKLIIEEGCTAEGIPIPMVNSKNLSKVLEYCKKHAKAVATDDDKEELKLWDAEYMKVGEGTLYHLMLAVNYLSIKRPLDLTSQTMADMIKGKTPQEIRKAFNIENDFTPEEEEAIRKEHEEWGLPSQQH